MDNLLGYFGHNGSLYEDSHVMDMLEDCPIDCPGLERLLVSIEETWMNDMVLRVNLVRVEIRELRPEVVAESDEVLVHYRSRTNG